MKVLTLTQPWATLVAFGAKRIETRSFWRSYRGSLAIHAAAGLGPVHGKRGLIELIKREPFWSVLREAFAFQLDSERYYPADAETIVDELPFGTIVAVCALRDCVRIVGFETAFGDDSSTWHLTDQERAFGNYAPGRFAWLLSDVRALPEPVPCRGQFGLWEYQGELHLEEQV